MCVDKTPNQLKCIRKKNRIKSKKYSDIDNLLKMLLQVTLKTPQSNINNPAKTFILRSVIDMIENSILQRIYSKFLFGCRVFNITKNLTIKLEILKA